MDKKLFKTKADFDDWGEEFLPFSFQSDEPTEYPAFVVWSKNILSGVIDYNFIYKSSFD